ncbi:MAG: cytosol aminopeptidase [Gammaproteobacteria bacterium]|nr:MAG: cytosol aminopeptidase [Gammaproteobacteria bacterium]
MTRTPRYRLAHDAPENHDADLVAVGVYKNGGLSPAAERIDQASGGRLRRLLESGELDGEAGGTLLLYDLPGVRAARVLLVGLGEAPVGDAELAKAHGAAAQLIARLPVVTAVSLLAEGATGARLRRAVLACDEAFYRFEAFRRAERPLKLRTLVFDCGTAPDRGRREALRAAEAIAAGVRLAKDLGNLPGNVCTPRRLAKEARTLAARHEAVSVTVLDEKDLKRLGMGAFLAVAQGSTEPPRLILIEYRGGGAKAAPVAFVGKGITFDSGGICLKPAAQMDEMKFDMCGAAAVLGLIQACALFKLKRNVLGVIAAAENLPSGQATRPGDIVTTHAGKTVEILNTDAEGRLVLCDALSYIRRYKPAAVIDIATLTGACLIALGRIPSGLLGNDEALVEALRRAGERSGDRVWPLPLWPEYRELLKSPFADLANVGNREAGTITAASFLSHFTEDYRWAHLDIAGTAWKTGNEKGATGRPVPLLMDFLLEEAP